MALSTRNIPVWYQLKYGNPCGTLTMTGGRFVEGLVESVESYRGRPEHIKVGSKNRMVFRPFQRWKRNLGTCPVTQWCLKGPSLSITSTGYAFHNTRYWHEYYWSQNKLTNTYYITGDFFPCFTKSQVAEYGENLRAHVINDLYVKANSPRFEGAVFLAELTENIVSIRRLFMGCVRAFVRSGEAWKQTKHLALNSEELWLWWRYMLMPTMMEVEDILAALEPQKAIDRIQDGDRNSEPLRSSGSVHYRPQWNDYSSTCETAWEAEINYGIGGALDILSRIETHEWGTSNWDLVRAGWEVIPFSFVFDWFVKFGDYLTILRDLEIVYAQSYATYAVDCKMTVTHPDCEHGGGEENHVHTFLQERIVNLEPPKLPLIDSHWNNLMRSVDLISLAAGMIKRILGNRRR